MIISTSNISGGKPGYIKALRLCSFLAQRADAMQQQVSPRVGENVEDIDEGSGISHRRLEASCGGLPSVKMAPGRRGRG